MDSRIETQKIFALASVVRKALEEVPKNQLPITLCNFPHGSCGDASLLLGEFLTDRGFGKFHYVLGELNQASHAWLQKDGLVVDITADQFPGNLDPVIVKKR